jgi:DNA anti-recombination protein RmuC
MDQETKDYLDQKHVSLARKEDMEKLRQEMKATFRKWKEENQSDLLESKKEIKADLEELGKEWKADIEAIRRVWTEGVQKLREDTQSMSNQSGHTMDVSFHEVKEDVKAILNQVKQDLISNLRLIREGAKEDLEASLSSSRREAKADLDRLDERLTRLQEQTQKAAEEFGPLGERVQAGLTEVKEELSSMFKFSFAELERRLNALEARIKVLEKIVLQ